MEEYLSFYILSPEEITENSSKVVTAHKSTASHKYTTHSQKRSEIGTNSFIGVKAFSSILASQTSRACDSVQVAPNKSKHP